MWEYKYGYIPHPEDGAESDLTQLNSFGFEGWEVVGIMEVRPLTTSVLLKRKLRYGATLNE